MALMGIQCNITEALSRNYHSIGIFFDLAKAFGTVDHSILIAKLQSYGIRGMAIRWLLDYLSDGTQYVSFKDALSSINAITWGVLQGSILDPPLFLI